jgi:hypothetical protein
MTIRNTRSAWAALAVGALLLSGVGGSVRAQDNCDDCEPGRWQRFTNWCRGGHCQGGGQCHGRGCSRCRFYRGDGTGMWNHYSALDGTYCDQRDTRLYSAQGYNVPVAVPLAPVVKNTYNYGWGVPSTRLTRVGAQYNQWYPTTTFSQNGGYLPGSYPIYQPTDTTQMGAYYVHVPRWGRYPGY